MTQYALMVLMNALRHELRALRYYLVCEPQLPACLAGTAPSRLPPCRWQQQRRREWRGRQKQQQRRWRGRQKQQQQRCCRPLHRYNGHTSEVSSSPAPHARMRRRTFSGQPRNNRSTPVVSAVRRLHRSAVPCRKEQKTMYAQHQKTAGVQTLPQACVVCSVTFTVTARERLHKQGKGCFDPKRCLACRKSRRK